jgi:hypothetical protein
MEGRKNFFLEKKKQKTFIHWRTWPWTTYAIDQKFFGSFFQKRTTFLLNCFPLPPAPPPPAPRIAR